MLDCDWSSDVCSSDLAEFKAHGTAVAAAAVSEIRVRARFSHRPFRELPLMKEAKVDNI
jgi:hypothetical protein